MPMVEVPSGSTVKDFAEILDVSTAQIIKLLMGLGELATITQSLSDDAIELIAGGDGAQGRASSTPRRRPSGPRSSTTPRRTWSPAPPWSR